ncbi:glycosyltransferase involved in cell wall biosynthesis [Micromonospora palomenae]|uniref:Glycosyltransferase involved in cell wall biosynthesis n=1 Tax=Micromonospora palomenae TaxID=1461247 RepID=A0A561VHU3_9ACTN|nr:glycosyltransferase family 4 protein [Micromonospora palomenae]TWG11183.1 glycosyltransferase involved in cell wall biosynthesis [Micromonospora palomenae]
MTAKLSIGIVSVSETAGGAEAHTLALGQGLAERGHTVVLHGRCPGWESTALPWTVPSLGPKWSRRTLLQGILRVPLEQRAVQALPPSSTYYMQFKREQIALTRTLAQRAPVVWTEHGRWTGALGGRALFAAYARAARHVSRIVCVSGEVAQDLHDVVDPERLVIIPNAIDTDRCTPCPPDQKRHFQQRLLPAHLQDRPVAVLASRLHPAKRHERAIKAAIAGGIALVVVGDGPDRTRLEDIAGGRGDIVFMGWRDDTVDFLRASDLYLYCGADTDGTSLAVLEAASCGLPVVGFDGDPGSDLVSRCGGLLLTDTDELTPDRVDELLSTPGGGRDYVTRMHGIDTWLDSYERIFLDVAA